jgi:dolichol-phosphate mannosyltransferase
LGGDVMNEVGLVIPSYNEHECIAQLINEIRFAVPEIIIVVVDDSPNERTAEALLPLLNQQTILIRRKTKGGRGTAVIEGIAKLLTFECEIILEMDADFSHPPAQIPQLIEQLKKESLDLLIASRYLPESRIQNWPLSRRVFSFSSNKLARAVLGVPICDYTNGFRCYSRAAADLVAKTCGKLGTGFISLSEILVNLYFRGFRVAEVPTVFVNRVRGESSLNAKEITNAVKGLARIYGLKNQLRKDANEGLAKSNH